MNTFMKELNDAKDYGSILSVTVMNFATLYAWIDEIRNENAPSVYSYLMVDIALVCAGDSDASSKIPCCSYYYLK